MSVVSEKLYSPQQYLELVTGNTYIIDGDNDVDKIESILEDSDICYWSYPLSEIDHIVEEKLNVVLVDCLVYNNDTGEYEHVYRWFEVDGPDECDDEINIELERYPLVVVDIKPWLEALNFKVKRNKIIDTETSDRYYLTDIKEAISEYVTDKIENGWDYRSLEKNFFENDIDSFKKNFYIDYEKIVRE